MANSQQGIWRRRRLTIGAAIAVAALAITACTSGGKTPGAATSSGGSSSSGAAASPVATGPEVQGITKDSINVGVITSKTGFYAFESGNVEKAFEAMIDYTNKNGGVNGRKINLTLVDDTSTAAGNKTAAQSLVQAKDAFMVYENAGVSSGGGQFLQDNNVPVVANPVDVAVSTFTNFFATTGGLDPNPKHVSTTTGLIMKLIGAKKVGSLGLAVSQASVNAGQSAITSSTLAGLQAGYFNPNIPIGNASWTPYVLGFKDSNTDGFVGVLDNPNVLSWVTAAKQQGLALKELVSNMFVNSIPTGTSKDAAQGIYVTASWQPTQIPTAATEKELSILNAAGISGQADYDSTMGYTNALLLIEMLQQGGQNPTRTSVITNTRKVTNWDVGGLSPVPIDFSKELTAPPVGGPGNCSFVLQIQGSDFVPVQKTPVCGTVQTVP